MFVCGCACVDVYVGVFNVCVCELVCQMSMNVCEVYLHLC